MAGGAEEPDHRGEADQQEPRQANDQEKQAHHGYHFAFHAAHTTEDVEAREADEATEEDTAGNLQRGGPELVVPGECPEDKTENGVTADHHQEEEEGDFPSIR